MRLASWYYCDNKKCDYQKKSDKLLHGQVCPKCQKGKLDDFPPNVDMSSGSSGMDEGSLEYFNRYIAGDR